jgi:hypothetical protein
MREEHLPRFFKLQKKYKADQKNFLLEQLKKQNNLKDQKNFLILNVDTAAEWPVMNREKIEI